MSAPIGPGLTVNRLGVVHIVDPDTGLVWEHYVTESPVPPPSLPSRRGVGSAPNTHR